MKIYLAGPLFSEQDRVQLEKLAFQLEGIGCKVYLPHRDAGDLGSVKIAYGKKRTRHNLFERDVSEVRTCDLLVALLDGADVDSGTAVEIGMAHASGTPVVGLKTDFYRRNKTINNMIWGACSNGRTLAFDTTSIIELVRTMSKKAAIDRKGCSALRESGHPSNELIQRNRR